MRINPGIWAAAVLLAAPALAQSDTYGGTSSKSSSEQRRDRSRDTLGQQPSTEPSTGGSGMTGMHQGSAATLQNKAPQAVIDALQTRVRDYEQAFNSHDVAKLLTFYTPDATILSPTGAATGKSEIEQQFRKDHADTLKNATATFTLDSIRALGSNMAIMDLTQRIQGATTTSTGGQLPSEMHATVVTSKRGNQWMAEAVRVFPSQVQPTGVGGSGTYLPSEHGTGGSNLPSDQGSSLPSTPSDQSGTGSGGSDLPTTPR